MVVYKGGHDDPFGDLGAMDSGRGGERDAGIGVDWGGLNVIRAGGEKMYQFWERCKNGGFLA